MEYNYYGLESRRQSLTNRLRELEAQYHTFATNLALATVIASSTDPSIPGPQREASAGESDAIRAQMATTELMHSKVAELLAAENA